MVAGVLVGLAALVGAEGPASANGRFPAAGQLVLGRAPDSPWVLRTTFGLLLSRDRGKNWDWICERALDPKAVEEPTVALFSSNRILAGAFTGLFVSSSDACQWSRSSGAVDGIAAIDVALVGGNIAVALGGGSDGIVDGSLRYRNQVYRTEDEGTTWQPLGPALDPSLVVETVDSAPSDPTRIYVSAVRPSATGPSTGILLASKDRGATYTELAIPMDASREKAPLIAAVDPVDPERVYLRTSGTKAGRILVSEDGGKSVREVYAGSTLKGFALSEDGSKIFVGGPADGVLRANRKDLVFSKRSAVQVECLAYKEGALVACSNEQSGFTVGISIDDGSTFEALLHLEGVRGPLGCPAPSSVAACVPEWPAQSESLGIRLDGGADAGDAGKPVPNLPTTPPADSGCSLPQERPLPSWGGLGLALLGIWPIWRRKLRQRGSPKDAH